MSLWHKALSVRAPWAWLIATGRKRIELRTRSTSYRGPLLICASRKVSESSCLVDGDVYDAAMAAPRGVSLCLVDLVDCRLATADDTRDACSEPEPDEWAWVLRNPRPVEPLPVSGALGFFWVDEHGRRGPGPVAPAAMIEDLASGRLHPGPLQGQRRRRP